MGLGFDLQPLANDPWLGWHQAIDDYLNGGNQSNNRNQGQNIDSGPTGNDKKNIFLFDERLKAIENLLNLQTPKIPKLEPNEVIEILDDSVDDNISREFKPKMTSTRVKEEKEDE